MGHTHLNWCSNILPGFVWNKVYFLAYAVKSCVSRWNGHDTTEVIYRFAYLVPGASTHKVVYIGERNYFVCNAWWFSENLNLLDHGYSIIKCHHFYKVQQKRVFVFLVHSWQGRLAARVADEGDVSWEYERLTFHSVRPKGIGFELNFEKRRRHEALPVV